jgi:hypothetical protein
MQHASVMVAMKGLANRIDIVVVGFEWRLVLLDN